VRKIARAWHENKVALAMFLDGDQYDDDRIAHGAALSALARAPPLAGLEIGDTSDGLLTRTFVKCSVTVLRSA